MKNVNPASIDWDALVDLTRSVGTYFRWPVSVVLIFLSIYLYQSDITQKFRRAHSMKTLAQQEQANWPAIMPVLKHDLIAMDINVGPLQ